MPELIHEFDNGIKLFDDHLTSFQRDRYKNKNVHEVEEEEIFVKIINNLPEAGCFVNIGAAVGYYTLLAKKLAPGLTIHAVEPLKQHQKFFKENILLNGFKLKDFTLHHEAIARLNGMDYFLDHDYGSMLLRESEITKSLQFRLKTILNALTNPQATSSREKKKYFVHTITLEHLIKRIGRSVDLLLMDVQGLEADVLQGGAHALQSGAVKTLLIGTHGQDIHKSCLDILQAYGFTILYEIPDPATQPDGIIHASRERFSHIAHPL